MSGGRLGRGKWAIAGAMACVAGSALAGPVQNASFANPLGAEWYARNSTPSGGVTNPPTLTRTSADARPAVAPDTTDGWSLRVEGRNHVQDSPGQSVRQALVNSGSGKTWAARFWFKPDAYASVRLLLRWSDSGVQQNPLILAEAVVMPGGEWVNVEGSRAIAWSNSLTAASIDFEVEQLHRGSAAVPTTNWFPAYYLDDITMELDDDGDGLLNAEETGPAAGLPDDRDSDDDGMTDDWEKRFAFDPRDPADAAADTDGDGLSNFQEFHGATDPGDANSYPGKASDPAATGAARALLRYLALRPARGEVLVGQMVSDNAVDHAAYYVPLTNASNGGRAPAILGLAVEHPTATPLDIAASIDHAIPHAQAGGLVQIKWAAYNPWVKANGTFGNAGYQTAIDIPGLLDPAGTPTTTNSAAQNLAARAVFDSWIDTVAAEFDRFNTATGSAPILFRPMSEMNGPWFWWGGRTREEYLDLWNHLRDRMIKAPPEGHGLHNLIWVYESDSGIHSHPVPNGVAAASDYYYPGDDRVDLMCHNLYDSDWVLPFDANAIYRRYPKVYGIPQAGPEDPERRIPGAFSNMTYVNAIVGPGARLPRASMFVAWNSFSSHDDDDGNPNTPSGNDDADASTPDTPSLKRMAIIDCADPAAMMTNTAIITLGELRWRAPEGISATATATNQIAISWAPVPSATGYRIERSADGTNGWTVIGTTTNTSLAATMPGPKDVAYFRVLAQFGADEAGSGEAASGMTWSVLQQWKNDRIGDPFAPDLGDPDRDGIRNLLEYALAGDPLMFTAGCLPRAGVTSVADVAYLTMAFRRPDYAPDILCSVESSTDLVAWETNNVVIDGLVPAGDGTETVTYRDSVPVGVPPSRFLRTAIQLAP